MTVSYTGYSAKSKFCSGEHFTVWDIKYIVCDSVGTIGLNLLTK